MKRFLVSTVMTLLFTSLFAQTELYMPIEFQKAYKNKTRSFTGEPGENYWQNFAFYKITATVQPGTWKINGHETVVYKNNSPDSLRSIIIRTYPDLYKKGGKRLLEVHEENITQGMLIKKLSIDNEPVDLTDNEVVNRQNTVFILSLKIPLAPGNSLTLETDWETQLPLLYDNRLGVYDSNAAFMAYWYPQIGVYDDIDGWDTKEYLAMVEFYREFADYDVQLRVPSDYMIWATGELQNPKEVYSHTLYENWEKSKLSNETKVLLEGREPDTRNNSDTKTWHFAAKNVIDFAAGISSYFRWEASSVEQNGKRILSNLVYPPKDSTYVKNVLTAQNNAIQFFNDEITGTGYPWPQFTTFIGVEDYDGMEFPMMANNGVNRTNPDFNPRVTVHEFAHTYFPMYVGVNEVKYAWMEEGWAVFMTTEYMNEFLPDAKIRSLPLKEIDPAIVSRAAGDQRNIPLFTPSYLITERRVHSLEAYKKPAILYSILKEVFGKEQFANCLQGYIERWNGKHPTPYDFFFTMENLSGQDLTWLWKPWIFEFGYPDLEIKQLNGKILVEKLGALPVPVHLTIEYKSGEYRTMNFSAEVWKNGETELEVEPENAIDVKSILLDTSLIPDSNPGNNKLILN